MQPMRCHLSSVPPFLCRHDAPVLHPSPRGPGGPHPWCRHSRQAAHNWARAGHFGRSQVSGGMTCQRANPLPVHATPECQTGMLPCSGVAAPRHPYSGYTRTVHGFPRLVPGRVHRFCRTHRCTLTTCPPSSTTKCYACHPAACLPYRRCASCLLQGMPTAPMACACARRGLVNNDTSAWRFAFLLGMGLGGFALLGFMPGAFEALPASFTVSKRATLRQVHER